MNPQQPYYGQPPQQPVGGGPPYQQPPAAGQQPPGQPPYQQQPYYNYGQQPVGQYPNQQYAGGPPPPNPGQYPPQQAPPPQGAPPPGQYQNPPYSGQPPPPGGPQYQQQPGPAYGQHPPAPYGQPPPAQPQQALGQPPYGQQQPPYPPQQYGTQPQQWQQPPPAQQGSVPPYGYNVPPTPASPGYDPAQKAWAQHVDTSSDVETIRKAMKGMGCDERALIRVFTNAKYSNPWAMQQLARDYNSRFIRDLAKDIESETRGDLETALLALIRGPLEHDVRVLERALDRAGTDEDALMDVLLCRSNADVRAIAAEYKRLRNRDLLLEIREDVDDSMYRLYSMVLAATRAEDAAPVAPADIDQKVTELQRATEGTVGANVVAVAQIFASCNDAQMRAVTDAYRRKYHRGLQDVVEKEFRGDMEDALLRIMAASADRALSDAQRLREPLMKTVRKDRLLISRVVSLYWDRPRFDAAKAAYKKRFGTTFAKDIKEQLSGDYEDLMLALIADK